MFGDVFETPEDLINGDQTAAAPQYFRKAKNCAADLELPALKRDSTTFVGLKNQGATCYLNSLLQSVYMVPEFRNAILRLPLCAEDDVKQPSNFVLLNKFNFLFPLQKLFAELNALDIRATITEEVTNAFGWNNNEQLQQHDIQEAYRIIFDILERALEGTSESDCIIKNFKGVIVNHLECLNCGMVKERESDFYDLILQVKNIQSLEESLLNMLTMERLEGSNQYHCDTCDKKVDALKGVKVRKYPPILTFSLCRFDFDFEKLERVKINDRFTFGLELDISIFAEKPESYGSEDERIYELCGVLIHRGDAFGGHYKAYIHDSLKEGDWEELIAKYAAKKADLEKKTNITEEKKTNIAEEQKMVIETNGENIAEDQKMVIETNGQKKHDEIQTNKDEMQIEKEGKNQKPDDKMVEETTVKDFKTNENPKVEEQKMSEEAATKDTDDDDDDDDEANKESARPSKKKGKGGKGGKRSKKKGKHAKTFTSTSGSKKTDKAQEENKNHVKYDDSVFDETEFPFPFTNPDLRYHWFDFNDSSVTAIPMNRIQHQFGGSTENAYILIYRQRALNKKLESQKTVLPSYLQKEIDARNSVLESERAVYNEAESNIEVHVFEPSNIDFENKVYKPDFQATKSKKIRIRIDAKVGDLLHQIAKEFPESDLKFEEIAALETVELANKHLHFKRELNASHKDVTIGESGLEHLSNFVVIPNKSENSYKTISDKIGDEFVPIRVNARNLGNELRLLTYQSELFGNIRIQLQELFGIPLELQYIVMMKDSGPSYLNKDLANDGKKLVSLGVTDNADFIVNKIDESQLKALKGEKETEQDKMRTRQAARQEKQQEEELLSSQTENLTSILVESDEKIGVTRYYVDLDWKLEELIDNIKKKLDIDPASQRRLRRLLGNTPFYEEELGMTLRQLAFEEGGIRLRLEYGKSPQFGNLTVRVKNQSKLKKEDSKTDDDIVCFPNELISELKKKACDIFGLEPSKHKLYKTDWLEDPVAPINKEDRSIQTNVIKMGDILVLRDNDSVIPKEILNFHVHHTKTGFHNDSEYVDIVSVREDQTLEDLKKKILTMPVFQPHAEVPISHVRVREMRKDMFFGKILRGDKKLLKRFDLGTNTAIVVQILSNAESLEENEMVLIVRKRLVDIKIYGEPKELIFKAGSCPTINELKAAVIKAEGLDLELQEIELAKYFPHEFEWLFISEEYIEEESKQKKKGGRGGKGKKDAKKSGKKGGQEQQKQDQNEKFNLKKAPYLLKDGDVIGYRVTFECLEIPDDFQTIEDQENREKFLQEKARIQSEITSTRVARDKNAGGIHIEVDF